MTTLQAQEVSVLIVGASLVGLTLSALLAQHGITDLLCVEKHSSTAIHPRATVMMPRTMQVFRQLGLYDTMIEESLKYYDLSACIVTVESLAGKLIKEWMRDVNEGIENVSATRRVFLTQQALEPLLRARAKELGAEIQFSTEMTSFSQHGDHVIATLRDTSTGETREVRVKYMIACDGFRSPTRSALQIPMHGPGLLSRASTIYFQIRESSKIRLARLANAHYSGVIYVSNPTLRAFFRFDRDKKESFLVINSAGEQGTEESRFPADTMTMAKAEQYLKAAIGDDGIEFDIHQISSWEAEAAMPEHLQVDRVFLAGDSAHQMPPSGGFGGNTGVQDAHNLAWKLAMVLKDEAGRELLDTYEQERWPVAKLTVDNAFAHYVHRTEPSLAHLVEKFNVHEVPVECLELAYRYQCKAIRGEEESKCMVEDPATAIARPGSVAHHVMVQALGNEKQVPIAEMLGPNFVLFLCADDRSWSTAAKKAVPDVEVQRLVYTDVSAFAKRYDITTSGAVLVRPDGFVAWSAKGAPSNGTVAETVFREALQAATCR